MTTKPPLRIAIAGLGTVGGGVIQLLSRHKTLIAERAGRPLKIVAVCARSRTKKRPFTLPAGVAWLKDPVSLAAYEKADVIVELMGGAEGAARRLVTASLKNGRSVVTANKALLAHHGYELAKLAEKHDTDLRYEAAAGGSIPIIKSLREGFAANRVEALYGILNGTCNYILTDMRRSGRAFADVLGEAQKKGYAEANPAFDIDGIDAAHKLCLLAALGFGVRPDLAKIAIRGIRHVTVTDIACAAELGYRIRLLAIARRQGEKLIQSVEPCLVPAEGMMGAVEGVNNAILVDTDPAGRELLTGRGAGAGPTASAVVADLIDIARGVRAPAFGVPAAKLPAGRAGHADDLSGRFYIRFTVPDRPGVLAGIAAQLRDHNVSVESMIQHGRSPKKSVSIIMTTHPVRGRDIRAAIGRINKLALSVKPASLLRIEDV